MSSAVMLGGVGVKRPPAPGARVVSFHLVLAEAERDELRAMAVAHGVTVARLLVESTLTGEAPAGRREVRQELRVVRTQLVGVAANVNTATRKVHATREAASLLRLGARVEAALLRLDVVLGRLR